MLYVSVVNASKHLWIHLTILQVFDRHHRCILISANLELSHHKEEYTPFLSLAGSTQIAKAKGHQEHPTLGELGSYPRVVVA